MSLSPSDGSFTASAGGTHTASLSGLPCVYSSIYLYVKSPNESGLGTSVQYVSGDGNSMSASLSWSIPSDASGDYVITAYTYLTNNSIVQPSYTVTVSSGGGGDNTNTTPTPSSTPTSPAPSTPTPVSVNLQSGDGSYSATVGDVHVANLTLGAAPSYVFWYIQDPWDTSPRLMYKDTSGSLTSQFSYSLGNPGNYVFSVSGTRASDGAAITGSYTVYVSQ